MLDRIIAQIALGLFDWLEKRIARGNVVIDADVDRPALRRASTRIRDWVHKQDRLRGRGHPNASGGTKRSPDEGVPPDQR